MKVVAERIAKKERWRYGEPDADKDDDGGGDGGGGDLEERRRLRFMVLQSNKSSTYQIK